MSDLARKASPSLCTRAVRLLFRLFALLCLLLLCGVPVHADSGQNTYSYPGYDVSANGYVDLMRYMKQITITVNGQEYSTSELQSLSDAGTPLTLTVGDTMSFNFRFALCGRAYMPDDPTQLDEANSTHVTYVNGTTYLNGQSVSPGSSGILDDSSLMVENRSSGSSYLRMDISWLLELCPDGINIEYTEGGVSFDQDGNYLYVYFPNGIGNDTYANPGYFSIGITVDKTVESIYVPATDGYYVPGTDGWTFRVNVTSVPTDMEGVISTYGDIVVHKHWETGGQEHPPAVIVLHYTENGVEQTSRRTLTGDDASVTFTIQNDMTNCWLEEDMTGLEGYTSTLTSSKDGKTYTFTNYSSKEFSFGKRSITGTDELPGASLKLYCLSSDGSQTLIDQWTSGTTPHTVRLYPGRFLLHEVSSPAGYAVSLDIPFTVTDDLTIRLDGDNGTVDGDTLIITDKELVVKFAKVDAAGNPLAGAVLTLTDKTTGEEIDRWTTETEPHVITLATESGKKLVAGHTYVLHEESAPAGYQLAQDIEFVFNGDGTIPGHGYYTVTMQDQPVATPSPTPTPTPVSTPPVTQSSPPPGPPTETVQTGDDPLMWVWLALGIVCLCGAAVTGLYYYRRSCIPVYWRLGMRDE